MFVRFISCVALLVIPAFGTGCHDFKTIYETVDAYPEGDGYKLVLAKSPIFYWAVATAPVKRSVFYTAHGVVKDGRVVIAPHSARLLDSAGGNYRVQWVPIEGTNDWIRLPEDNEPGEIYKFSAPRRKPRKIASFHYGYRDPATSALAISQSGRHLLIAGPDDVKLWDLTTESCTAPRDLQLLSEVRKKLIDSRGWTGQWWISDDCRYVVILPPDEHYNEGSESWSSAAEVATLAGISVDVQHQGIVLDRNTSRVTAVARIQAGSSGIRTSLIGANAEDGNALLLYFAESALSGGREEFAIVNADGREIVRHDGKFRSRASYGLSVNAFDRLGKLVLFRPTLWIGGPEAAMWAGNWKSGRMQRAIISTPTVSAAIEGK